MFKALACFLKFHVPASGIVPARSVFWECSHCHELVPGARFTQRRVR